MGGIIISVVKHFISDAIRRTEIDEFLQERLEKAGFGGVDISKTPLGTHLVIYAMRPGLVIGRGGRTIRKLAKTLEEKFGLSNPQISVSEMEIPELNAYVMASRIATGLRRGYHYRRSGYWALNRIMEAGAQGAEIVISGKLRSRRGRYEKFKDGYLPKCGHPASKYMREAEVHVPLKPGTIGVKVKIIPPDAEFPDKIQIVDRPPEEEIKEEREEGEEMEEEGASEEESEEEATK